MELFNEVKNRYFQLVFKIINECSDGKERSDILKIIDEGEFEQKVIGKNQESFTDIILNSSRAENNLNFLEEKEGLFYPVIKNDEGIPLPIRFTNIEKAWLKELLEEPWLRMLMKGETIQKLQKELESFDSPIKSEYIEMTNTIKLPEIEQMEAYCENFRLILKALIKEKPIIYTNIDKWGNIYKDTFALPISLEYSMRDSRFRVSLYSIDEMRPIMANIFSITELSIVDKEVPISREEAKKLLHEKRYCEEPIVIEVTDKRAAMERCFMCFSGMDRTSRALGNNKYEISLNYYVFEEENIIRNIISLGQFVKVISPQRIADEIISRVKKALELANK